MNILVMSALGVGAATVFGAVAGFIFRGIGKGFCDMVMSFAAGVMLVAALLGLIVPAIVPGEPLSLLLCVLGIPAGSLCLHFADRCIPGIEKLLEKDLDIQNPNLHGVLIFVLAIAIHNFPEGLAAGVGFGGGDTARALSVVLGIALQNIPEGMVIISPMLSVGLSGKKTFILAAFTGAVEVVGTFLGYLLAGFAGTVLPFAMGFAGGTMLYVICDEMIPSSCGKRSEKGSSFAFIAGVCIMLVFNSLIV